MHEFVNAYLEPSSNCWRCCRYCNCDKYRPEHVITSLAQGKSSTAEYGAHWSADVLICSYELQNNNKHNISVLSPAVSARLKTEGIARLPPPPPAFTRRVRFGSVLPHDLHGDFHLAVNSLQFTHCHSLGRLHCPLCVVRTGVSTAQTVSITRGDKAQATHTRCTACLTQLHVICCSHGTETAERPRNTALFISE
jgi:hypothetical protein